MSEVATIERVVAVLCLGHITVNILLAVEAAKTAVLAGKAWKATVDFTTIAAFVLSVCVMVKWVVMP